MWDRIEYDAWMAIIPILAFILTFSVFVLLVTRALLMKKSRASELARVPLSDQPTTPGKRGSDS